MGKFQWQVQGLKQDALLSMRSAAQQLLQQSYVEQQQVGSHKLYFDLANLCIECMLFDEALDHFRASVAADPQFIDAYLTLSQFLSSINRDQDALQCLEGAKSIFEANLNWSKTLND